jgi:hypothetical protein
MSESNRGCHHHLYLFSGGPFKLLNVTKIIVVFFHDETVPTVTLQTPEQKKNPKRLSTRSLAVKNKSIERDLTLEHRAEKIVKLSRKTSFFRESKLSLTVPVLFIFLKDLLKISVWV